MGQGKDVNACRARAALGGAVAGVGVSFSSDSDPRLCAGIGGVVLGVLGAIYGLGSLLWLTVGGFRDGSSTRTQGWRIRLGPPA